MRAGLFTSGSLREVRIQALRHRLTLEDDIRPVVGVGGLG